MSSNKLQLFFAVLFFTLLSHVIGHSYVTSPATRSNQAETQTGCRGPSCLGPCEVPLSRKVRSPITAQRGDSITVKWPRNNHAGGFIRFAWAPTSLSDSHAAFDSHIQQINCHEVGGCHPDDASNPNGGDSGPSDGSSRACTSVIKVPLDLADGEWTLQWSWFGGAFALGDYYSCIDYKIVGGQIGLMTPVFVGGDFTFPNQNKCKFFNTDKLHVCTNEPCQTGTFPYSAQQSGLPSFNFSQSTIVQSTPPSVPATTASNLPSTTKANVPMTTGRTAPATTGMRILTTARAMPITTESMKPSTTGIAPIIPSENIPIPSENGLTPAPTIPPTIPPTQSPSPSPSTIIPSEPSTGCTLGYQFCVGTNQYQTCTNGRDSNYFASPQSCQTGLSCHPSATDNKIYCY